MIFFRTIRWQNFLSTGNQWTEIFLDRSKTTLIVGENGAGKSTLLDAVMFALYGRPYRNINKPLLINSITDKNCLVEIEFDIKNKKYMIRRGIKPAVFEIYCDEKLLDQNASIKEYQEYLEKHILKLNHKSFTQIVVIGSANFTPFMQLKANERREVIEDLLDIKIFSQMLTLLKERITTNKNLIIETKHSVDMFTQQLELTKKHMNEIRSMKNSDKEAKERKIKSINESILESQTKIESLTKEVAMLQDFISDHDKIKSKIEKMKKIEYQLNDKLRLIDERISFYEKNNECPTCYQEIVSGFKHNHIQIQNEKQNEIKTALVQFADQYGTLTDRLSEINEIREKINKTNHRIVEENSSVKMFKNNILHLQKEIKEVNFTDDNSLEALNALHDKIEDHTERYQHYLNLKERYDIALSMLKDGGIKAKIIKQYIPIINKLVNKYLAAMEFFVQFELDENFNEKIKSRFRDEFTYESFSEGEKMRIDLSLLFTWRSVANLRNSISTNLLIMDEVFDSSLDNTGTEEFLKIITELATGTNIFVISHKGAALFDKFHSVIKFEKIKNFSTISKNAF
jgi:DNA repair exonuclease SbcCD ATPase subunit